MRSIPSRIDATVHDATNGDISMLGDEIVYSLCGDEELKQHTNFPRHIALICDGNSRWAKDRNLPQVAGHSQGADNLLTLLRHLKNNYSPHIEYVTFYGFSTENWSRSSTEINGLWNIMDQTARRFQDAALKEGVRVQILGDLQDDRIPSPLRNTLESLEKETAIASEKMNTKLTVCIAINYGGRSDILKAALKLAESLSNSEGEEIQDLTTEERRIRTSKNIESVFDHYLCTDGIPDPDLLIRTGGQQRLSNFLLWNVAYSELYFSKCMWPDFNEKRLDEAIEWFQGTQRRYGGR